MEPTMDNAGEKVRFTGKISRIFTSGGVAVAKASGKFAGYSGKLFCFGRKKKVSGIKMPGKGLFSGGVLKKWGGEKVSVKIDIAKTQKKIEKLYFEIGKRSASVAGAKDDAELQELINEVRHYENEIRSSESRLQEMVKEKDAAKVEKSRVRADDADEVFDVDIENRIRDAMHDTLKSAVFQSSSDKTIFEKVSQDLLADDVEIRLLAAAELGRIGNTAAIPILKEAIGYGDVHIISEIIHALIKINHISCLPIFKNNLKNRNYRVRLGCLEGIYKIAGAESSECFINGLKDEHPEIRKLAASFIGWISAKDATPALMQTLKDTDPDVKKAAVASLSILREPASIMPLIRALDDSNVEIRKEIIHAIERITGNNVEFELYASGEKLRENIENLKEWWRKNKMADLEAVLKGADVEAPEPKSSVEEKKASDSGDVEPKSNVVENASLVSEKADDGVLDSSSTADEADAEQTEEEEVAEERETTSSVQKKAANKNRSRKGK